MADRDEARYWLALGAISGLGSQTYRQLLAEFGMPQHVFAASASQLERFCGAKVVRAILDGGPESPDLAPTLGWLDEDGNYLVTLADAEYPPTLLQISDPPPYLYVKGRLSLLRQPGLAIVGSRRATPQGEKDAEAFAHVLSEAGYPIVSGLALGIDAAAHRGGLRGRGASIAVVGTGLDIVYPARNRDLAHEMAGRGALISEFALGTPSIAQNFPRRNRIISGLSVGVLVVEAAVRSGSLITARLAAEQGREVFAMPGSIHSPQAKGCHQLIKQGAKLVESAQDVLEELGNCTPPVAPEASDKKTPSAGEARLLKAMGQAPTSVDALVQRTGLTAEQVCAMLLELELSGQVAPLPGGLYQAVF